jgi:hypothetical protein
MAVTFFMRIWPMLGHWSSVIGNPGQTIFSPMIGFLLDFIGLSFL